MKALRRQCMSSGCMLATAAQGSSVRCEGCSRLGRALTEYTAFSYVSGMRALERCGTRACTRSAATFMLMQACTKGQTHDGTSERAVKGPSQ